MPVVQLISHLQRLDDDRIERQPSDVMKRLAQGRRPDVTPAAKTIQGLVAVVAELHAALHLATVGPLAEGVVLDDPHRRGGRIVPAIGPTAP